ncbi:hypothetical protein ES705_03735 [subsurface metagenome]|nr:hypothetical protein [Clostridia bacterium]
MNKIKWWQWILIIIAVGFVFYHFYPKYEFTVNGLIRCNKITGKVEIAVRGKTGELILRLQE